MSDYGQIYDRLAQESDRKQAMTEKERWIETTRSDLVDVLTESGVGTAMKNAVLKRFDAKHGRLDRTGKMKPKQKANR